jgi:hypothetical protein
MREIDDGFTIDVPVGDTGGIRSKTREDSRPDELCSPDNPIHLPLL